MLYCMTLLIVGYLLQGCLPLVLMFDVKDEIEIDQGMLNEILCNIGRKIFLPSLMKHLEFIVM